MEKILDAEYKFIFVFDSLRIGIRDMMESDKTKVLDLLSFRMGTIESMEYVDKIYKDKINFLGFGWIIDLIRENDVEVVGFMHSLLWWNNVLDVVSYFYDEFNDERILSIILKNDALLSVARDIGKDSILLQVLDNNILLMDLMKLYGFKECGRIGRVNGEDTILMQKMTTDSKDNLVILL